MEGDSVNMLTPEFEGGLAGSLSSYPTDVESGLAIAVLDGVSLVVLILPVVQLQQMEFRKKV